jgi:hypothetical protein
MAAIAVAAGATAGGVAVAASSSGGSPASSPGGSGPVATAPVARTNLTATVPVGGSIGYSGSYTIAAPSGASPSEIAQAQQTVTQDQQGLAADEQAASDASAGDSQTTSAARADAGTAQSALAADQATLSSDQAMQTKDCAGTGASSAACSTDTAKVSQDTQKVSADKTSLTQAQRQLASAELAAKRDDDLNRAKIQSDQTRLDGDETTLASERATAVNPGTTYTWLPQAGDVIKEDKRVYSVSDVPVPLLYGSIVAYRAFYAGMSDGRDVGELTRDLIALGYGDGLARGNHYSQATAAAVERWQQALGLPVTGEILVGEVVFEPGPIRVTSVTASAGAAVGGGGGEGGGGSGGGGGGTVLTATGITPVVTVALDVTQESLVKPGAAVSVVLPDGTSTVGGHVQSVGNVATCPGGSGTGSGTGGSGGSAGPSPCSSAGSSDSGGSDSSPTVTVTITLDHAPPGASLDQAPVNVNITTQTARNVLAVPVNALLALVGGGFGVQVVTGRTTRLVGSPPACTATPWCRSAGRASRRACGWRCRRDPVGPLPGLAGRGPGAGA